MEKEGILLETGTNEVEILELLISGQLFGVNVLKVKQILTYSEDMVTALHAPGTHPSLKGTIMFQGEAILLIDLGLYLYPGQYQSPETTQVIVVCEFNNSLQGFLIDGVDRICRLTWDQFQAPSAILTSTHAMVTGIVTVDQRDVLMVDFESILDDMRGTALPSELETEPPAESVASQRSHVKLLLADDSLTVRMQLKNLLDRSGYLNYELCNNGAEAFAAIEAAEIPYDVLVTDIEMPELDGLTLCRRVKREQPDLKVIVLSSMISEQIAYKCESVGADAHLSKQETLRLVELIDEYSPMI